MRANQTLRPARTGRSTGARLAVILAAVALPACTGDNLFTGLGALGGLLGPEVDITVPANNFAMSVGDSITVTANVSAPDGVSQVSFRGIFSGGSTALNTITFTVPAPQDTTVTRVMRQSGAQTGNVR